MKKSNYRMVSIEEVLPVEATYDNCVIGNRGDVTLGWELDLPAMYTIREKEYDDFLLGMEAAVKLLLPWTIVHRQDIYVYDSYRPELNGQWLHDCYEGHFDGRPFLRHTARLFLTMSSRASVLGDEGGKMIFYRKRPNARYPNLQELKDFMSKSLQFISAVTKGGRIRARLITDAEYRGGEDSPGIIQQTYFLGRRTLEVSDIGVEEESLLIDGQKVISFSVPTTKYLPNVIESVRKDSELSSTLSGVYISLGSRIGVRLPCNHIVNQYVVSPPQNVMIEDLEKRRQRMEGGFNATENRVSAEELGSYIDKFYSDSQNTVYSHINVLAWDDEANTDQLHSLLSTALSDIGIEYCYNKLDVMNLLQAALPGGEAELGAQNYMLAELRSAIGFSVWETVDRGIPGGLLKLCDRVTKVPVRLDVQKLAKKVLNTMNYNVFLLGPSGSGKSFFTNLFLRNCWEAGEHVFIIDVGDSYQGQCDIINRITGGSDGFYHTWDPSHPFSFNPFQGFRRWREEDSNGFNFFLSVLKTIWSPEKGWNSTSNAVLESLLLDFIDGWVGETEPIFDDFYTFLGLYAKPEILEGTYTCGFGEVTQDMFDINDFLTSLSRFSRAGLFGFLLNNPNPPDLLSSRFVVFEVDILQKQDELLYALCVLCIMNSFDMKIRQSEDFKIMCIEEAWQAISRDFTANYLRGLWKTARKFQTSAMVVSQEITDITSSPIIKDAILDNSSIKMILDQGGNQRNVDILREMMGFGDLEADLISSVGRGVDPSTPFKEVFISWESKKCGVYLVEASQEEGYAYESDKVRKAPLFRRAEELGDIRAAIVEFKEKNIRL